MLQTSLLQQQFVNSNIQRAIQLSIEIPPYASSATIKQVTNNTGPATLDHSGTQTVKTAKTTIMK